MDQPAAGPVTMTRLKLIVFVAVLAGGIALPLAVRQNAQAMLHDKHETLRRQASELAQLAAENSALSNSVSARNASPSLSPEQLEELLKLRGEISGLVQQTNEAQKLREQNLGLRERVNAEQNFQPVTVSKASFAFAGYATPEAALKSFFWGTSRGDKKTILGSLTGDAAEHLGKMFTEMSDADFSAMKARLSENISGYQIVSEHALSDETVIVLVSLQGGSLSHQDAMTVKKIGGEWKLAVSDLLR